MHRLQGDLDKEGDLKEEVFFLGGLLDGSDEFEPFLMGKLTISMAIFNSYVKLPEGNC